MRFLIESDDFACSGDLLDLIFDVGSELGVILLNPGKQFPLNFEELETVEIITIFFGVSMKTSDINFYSLISNKTKNGSKKIIPNC